MKPLLLKKVLEAGPISENRSIGNMMVRKGLFNINSDFSLQFINHMLYSAPPLQINRDITANLSVRGRDKLTNEVMDSFPSSFASKNRDTWSSAAFSTLEDSV